jgi:hypothetical protein
VSDINKARRYYLLERHAADAVGDYTLAAVWHSKQESEPGTSLPADFPSRAALVAQGYSTVEDVHGADEAELSRTVALNARQASTVIAAVEALI